ncbi:uncharacterized protein EV420DRAFT_1652864 [Desarmillaria tabescens]|uniref:Uncharacterized protein n=1 Tax=Armillaria tabescens TaxID=1929756 RepID=A0AA39MJF5_ARMTA|nr:uncharacterized protein EV420DRAFT_1652864 [Desarmillaria tabescens]KAK0435919.1 hypothetical protein EV420DRAFT_1652864 [Desarmillaria tabescens]
MLVYNWKPGENSRLDNNDHSIQVIFTAETILVILASSINFYTIPPVLTGKAHTSLVTSSDGSTAPTPH